MKEPIASGLEQPVHRDRVPRSELRHEVLPAFDRCLHRLFGAYASRFLRRNFCAIRGSRTSPLPEDVNGRPLVIYGNHPSWWDPLVSLYLARLLFPDRRHYAPIDAQALERYGFFRRLGFYGIDRDTLRGASAFLRTSRRILQEPDVVLWMTPQGKFSDVRLRPVRFEPGLGHLAAIIARRRETRDLPESPMNVEVGIAQPRTHDTLNHVPLFLPLALDYSFGQERFPEISLRWGRAISCEGMLSSSAWTERLEKALEESLEELTREVIARDFPRFEILQDGRAGVGGVYDLWRRVKAWASGTAFRSAHGGPAH